MKKKTITPPAFHIRLNFIKRPTEMVASTKNLCTICKQKAYQLLLAKEKVFGKDLSTVIQKICGNERVDLPKTLVICTDCAVALLLADSVLTRLRQALALTSKPGDKKKQKLSAEFIHSDSEDSADATGEFENPQHSSKDAHADTNINQLTPMVNSTLLNWQFKCEFCTYETDKAKLFKKHISARHNYHNPRIYKCPQCSESYQRSNGIQNHIAYVHEKRPKQVRQRRKTFTDDTVNATDANLKDTLDDTIVEAAEQAELTNVHELSHAEENTTESAPFTFKCDQCTYETGNGKYFKRHCLRKHNIDDARIYKCNLCTNVYQRAHALQNHIIHVHEQKPRPMPNRRQSVPPDFVRNLAEKDESMAAQGLDKVDKAKENTETTKILQCEHCTYEAPDEYKLRKHLVVQHQVDSIAEESENYQQENNGDDNLFQKPKSKALDVAQNETNLQFRCEHCAFTTTKKKSYRKHLRNEHDSENAEIYKCNECGESYERENLLHMHILQSHGLDWSMSSGAELMLSDSSFDSLARKAKNRKHSNKTIDMSMPNDNSMLTDSNADHIENLMSPAKKPKLANNECCVICGKAFSTIEKMREHMDKKHGGDNIKRCANCDAQFHSQAKYDAHVFSEKCLNAKLQCQFSSCSKRFNKPSKLQQHMQLKHPSVVNNNDEDTD